jgi:Calcineurin-like phosphoesterase
MFSGARVRHVAIAVVLIGAIGLLAGSSAVSSGTVPQVSTLRMVEPRITFTVAGDYGANPATDGTLDGIARLHPDFHLAIGDLSYDQVTPETAWCGYVRSHVPASIPFEVLSGNHEDYSRTSDDVDNDANATANDGNIDTFAKCLPDALGSIGYYGREYYLDVPREHPLARIILLAPGLTFDPRPWGYTKGQPHYNWAAAAIDDARSQHIPWVIVGEHKPCLTTGTQPCGPGRDLLNLFIDRKVDLVISAHDHTYQRTQQLALDNGCEAVDPKIYEPECVVDGSTDNYTRGAGTVMLIVGTGGQPLTTIKSSKVAPYFVSTMGSNNPDPTHGFMAIQISANSLSAHFQPTTGSFKDAFNITPAGERLGTSTALP